MNFYNVAQIKNKLLSQIKLKNKEEREKFKKLMIMKTIIDNYLSSDFNQGIYFINRGVFIPENFLINYIPDHLHITSEIQNRFAVTETNQDFTYYLNTGTDFEDVIEYLSEPHHNSAIKKEKTIKKQNNKQKRDNDYKNRGKQYLEYIQSIINDKKICLYIDFEAFERQQDKLLEFGYCLTKGHDVLEQGHYIVDENKRYRNGKFVSDNRDNYVFGDSQVSPQILILKKLKKLLKNSDVLIAHGVKNDIKFLRKNSFDIDDYFDGKILDSSVGTYYLTERKQPVGLKKCYDNYLKEQPEFPLYFHNAGNDAYYSFDITAKLIDIAVNKKKNDKKLKIS